MIRIKGISRQFFFILILIVSVVLLIGNVLINGYTISYVQDVRFIYGGSVICFGVIIALLFKINAIVRWLDQHDRIVKPLF